MNKYFFLHIPKTAGTSLFRLFANNLGRNNVLHVRNAGNLGPKLLALRRYLLVGGHFTYSQSKYLQKNRYSIVFLRNPVDRFLSHYFFYRYAPIAPDVVVANAQSLDLSSFVDLYSKQKCNTICNAQVWFLTGSINDATFSMGNLLDLARENLSKINFTGIYEYFEDSVDLLSYDCKWPPACSIPVENVTAKRPECAEIDNRVLDRIAELNRYDLELYQYGVKLFNNKKRGILRECIGKNTGIPVISSPELKEAEAPGPGEADILPESPRNFGTYEIRIVCAEVCGEASLNSVIRSGEMAAVSIFFESSTQADEITVGFSIEDEYRQTIFGTNSSFQENKVSVEKGKTYCVKYNLRLDIGEGPYRLNVSLNSKNGSDEKCYHCWEHICGFLVAGHDGAYSTGIARLYPAFAITEVRQMLPLPKKVLQNISLQVKEIPKKVPGSREFFCTVEVSNRSGDTISSYPPSPVHLSYHWVAAKDRRPVVFEGLRSRIMPPLPPSDKGEYSVKIKAPDSKGEYVLRLTLVQERVAWLDSLPQPVIEDVFINVE